MNAPPHAPLVSIVVAAKDARALLDRFLAEWMAVPRRSVELVVVDGASADGTVELLQTRAPGGEADNLRWISRPDSGLAEAWDRGVLLARGAWVLFAGADDRLAGADTWAAAQRYLEQAAPAVAVLALAVEMVSPAGVPLGVVRPELGARFHALNTLPHQGVFHRRELWERHGGFDPSFRVCADYGFLLRLQARGEEIRLVPDLAVVRMTFGGRSRHDPLANLREYARAQRLHGVRRFRLVWWAAWLRAQARRAGRTCLGAAWANRWADRVRRSRGLPPVWTVE